MNVGLPFYGWNWVNYSTAANFLTAELTYVGTQGKNDAVSNP